MPVPDYQSIMLPMLRFAADGEPHSISEAITHISNIFDLSPDEREEVLPSGKMTRVKNRVGWARTYLKQAGLLAYPTRGRFQITDAGRALLETNPDRINVSVLKGYEKFLEFQNRRTEKPDDTEAATEVPESSETPEEALESAYAKLRQELEAEVLDLARSVSPKYFEQLVVDLLVRMGYGGNRADAARAVGQSGDEGIDGVINEDILGLDVVYIQAKRWEGAVSRPELQKFIGALAGKQARKGVFITTSTFTSGAVEFVSRVDPRVILIDGKRMAKLMVEHDVGVSTIGSFALKRIDSDYFDE